MTNSAPPTPTPWPHSLTHPNESFSCVTFTKFPSVHWPPPKMCEWVQNLLYQVSKIKIIIHGIKTFHCKFLRQCWIKCTCPCSRIEKSWRTRTCNSSFKLEPCFVSVALTIYHPPSIWNAEEQQILTRSESYHLHPQSLRWSHGCLPTPWTKSTAAFT